jgi:hypothetical protein
MKPMYIGTALVVVAVLAVLALVFMRRRPAKLKTDHYEAKWKELQMFLKDKKRWRDAVIEADALLDHALKRRKFRGKTMGERLVKAQRHFTDNDALWYGHKLRMQIEQHPDTKLKQNEVKDALIGIRRALKDLGALS